MCHNKKDCACGCEVKKVIKESLQITPINDDILSIHFSDVVAGDCTIDVEKYEDGSVSVNVNEDPKQTAHFDSLNDMVAFMGNDSVTEWGSEIPKKIFFNDKVLDAINKFVNQLSLQEAATPTKKITIYAIDQDNTISELLNSIKNIGNSGHGFEIDMDKELQTENDEAGIKTHFYWDGDGGDAITEIEIEDINGKEDKTEDKPLKEDAPGYLIPGINEAVAKLDPCSQKVFSLLKKYHKRMNIMNSKIGGKFMGFTNGESKDNREIQNLKNAAWDTARKGNLSTNEIMALDKKAKMEAEGKKTMTEAEDFDYYMNWSKELEKTGNKRGAEKMKGKAQDAKEGKLIDGEYITEASKVNLKLTSNTKRELIKRAKVALDAIYSIYDICERLNIEQKQFIDNLDEAFEGTNEMLTLLVTQNSIEKK